MSATEERTMITGQLLGQAQPDLAASQCQPDELAAWQRAATAVGATPFECKAMYAIAMIRQLAEAAILCLQDPRPNRGAMELPAYVLLADAFETLGRCVSGNRDEVAGSGHRLRTGLQQVLGSGGAVTTSTGTYDVDRCAKLRHFTTHGGTTPRSNGIDVLDGELTRQLINLLGTAVTAYWASLATVNDPARVMLAEALIRPLSAKGSVVFVADMHRMMSVSASAAGAGIAI